MIAKIKQKTQYGKMGTTGINVLSELDGNYTAVLAHSTQDALEWFAQFPAWKDVVPYSLEDGRWEMVGEWQKNLNVFRGLVDAPEYNAEFVREWAIIIPQNTIHENTGFKVP